MVIILLEAIEEEEEFYYEYTSKTKESFETVSLCGRGKEQKSTKALQIVKEKGFWVKEYGRLSLPYYGTLL